MGQKKGFIVDDIEEIYSGKEIISCVEVIDKGQAYIGTQGGSLVLINCDQKQAIGRSKIAKSGINAISGWTDGTVIAGSTKGSVCLLDRELYRLGKFRGHKDGVFAISQGLKDGINVFATGGGDGTWKLWDRRCLKELMTEKTHTDYISGIRLLNVSQLLVASSGDSLISIYNLRKGAVQTILPTMESEITCMDMVPGSSLAVGTLSGGVTIFRWGSWDEPQDRFSFKKNEIDSICTDWDNGYLVGMSTGQITQVNQSNHKTQDLFQLAANGAITVRTYISAQNDSEVIASNNTTKLYRRRQNPHQHPSKKENGFFDDLL